MIVIFMLLHHSLELNFIDTLQYNINVILAALNNKPGAHLLQVQLCCSLIYLDHKTVQYHDRISCLFLFDQP